MDKHFTNRKYSSAVTAVFVLFLIWPLSVYAADGDCPCWTTQSIITRAAGADEAILTDNSDSWFTDYRLLTAKHIGRVDGTQGTVYAYQEAIDAYGNPEYFTCFTYHQTDLGQPNISANGNVFSQLYECDLTEQQCQDADASCLLYLQEAYYQLNLP